MERTTTSRPFRATTQIAPELLTKTYRRMPILNCVVVHKKRSGLNRPTLRAIRFRTGLAELGCEDGWYWHTNFGSVCQLRSVSPLLGSPTAERAINGCAHFSVYFGHCAPSRRLYLADMSPAREFGAAYIPTEKSTIPPGSTFCSYSYP